MEEIKIKQNNSIKNERVGEVNYNNSGERMKIINYNNANDMLVQFDNELVVKTSYQYFKNGGIRTPVKRLGEINYNKYGSKMTIVDYISATNIIVQFDNGFKIKTAYKCFQKGEVTNLYDKTVYEVGYLGEGNYKTKVNGVQEIKYKIWKGILQRCYNKKRKSELPTYKDCVVCDEWLNYQNFAKWYDDNYYKIEGQRMELDKDILYKGNKIYSPETCVFAPKYINTLFIKHNATRGKYPLGVNYHKDTKRYEASCSTLKNNKIKEVFLGYHDTSEKAFEAYKTFKEKYIKEVADEYKNKIPQKLYDAMYNWKVEITD
jgi:hypothetical protein